MNIRSHLVVLLACTMFATVSGRAAQSLREAAHEIGLSVGTAVNPVLFSNPDYARALARQFNMIEPENQMKWRATEPARGVFDFRAGDRVVDFAKAHEMKVRGHNLFWGNKSEIAGLFYFLNNN